eukprot:2254829-Prymnesium_polylepis.1
MRPSHPPVTHAPVAPARARRGSTPSPALGSCYSLAAARPGLLPAPHSSSGLDAPTRRRPRREELALAPRVPQPDGAAALGGGGGGAAAARDGGGGRARVPR